MIYIEHRRHAKRTKPFPHLNAKGVRQARKLGESMGHFDMVVSSKLPRACESATAMGFGIDAESELLHIEAQEIAPGSFWDDGFLPIAKALHSSPQLQAFATRLRQEALDFIHKSQSDHGDGQRILFVSHGGLIELSLLALIEPMPGDPTSKLLEASDLGPNLAKCEGWSLRFDGKAFRDVKIHRLTK